jgi:hypothetical protein
VLAILNPCASVPWRKHLPAVHQCALDHSPWLRSVVVLGLATLLGCSDGKSSVTGAVTIDGQPVASGSVTFVKQSGELAREGAVIQGGSFHATVPPGTYKLELNGQKVVGKRKQKAFDGTDEEVEITEEAFPPRYNTKSELLQEIKPGANAIKLDLKSS